MTNGITDIDTCGNNDPIVYEFDPKTVSCRPT